MPADEGQHHQPEDDRLQLQPRHEGEPTAADLQGQEEHPQLGADPAGGPQIGAPCSRLPQPITTRTKPGSARTAPARILSQDRAQAALPDAAGATVAGSAATGVAASVDVVPVPLLHLS